MNVSCMLGELITVTIIVELAPPIIVPPFIQRHLLLSPPFIQRHLLFKPPFIQSHRLFNSPFIQHHLLFTPLIIQTCRHQLFKVAAHIKKGQSSAETQSALQTGTNYSNSPAPFIQRHLLLSPPFIQDHLLLLPPFIQRHLLLSPPFIQGHLLLLPPIIGEGSSTIMVTVISSTSMQHD